LKAIVAAISVTIFLNRFWNPKLLEPEIIIFNIMSSCSSSKTLICVSLYRAVTFQSTSSKYISHHIDKTYFAKKVSFALKRSMVPAQDVIALNSGLIYLHLFSVVLLFPFLLLILHEV
jgi:hypothetical protein